MSSNTDSYFQILATFMAAYIIGFISSKILYKYKYNKDYDNFTNSLSKAQKVLMCKSDTKYKNLLFWSIIVGLIISVLFTKWLCQSPSNIPLNVTDMRYSLPEQFQPGGVDSSTWK